MRRHLAKIQLFWLFWNVIFPLALPIAASAFVVGLWTTGTQNFRPNLAVIIDISPWALIFFALALIGSTISEFWSKLSLHPGIGIALLFLTVAVAIYAGMMVIWRHDESFVPGAGVYYVSALLLGSAIVACHWAHTEKMR